MVMNPYSDEDEDDIVETAREQGVIVPRSEPAIHLAACTMMGQIVNADLKHPDEGELQVTLCRNECCVNFTVTPNAVAMQTSFLRAAKGDDYAYEFLRKHSFQIQGLMGMN
jgi:hypothetical protein